MSTLSLIAVTVVAIAIIMGAMAIGVMVSGRRLRGSCGGVGSGACECEAAGRDPAQHGCARQPR